MLTKRLFRMGLTLWLGLLPVMGILPSTVASLPAPENDDFADATLIAGLDFSAEGYTSGATGESDEPLPCLNSHDLIRTVWYVFQPAVDTPVNLGIGVDASVSLAVYSATEASMVGLTHLYCLDWMNSSVQFVAASNTLYYLQIATGSDYGDGFYRLEMSAIMPPPNDNFADALPIVALPFQEGFYTLGATIEENEPAGACGPLYRTGWYRLRLDDSQSVSISLYSGYTAFATVYAGDSLEGLNTIGCVANRFTFFAEAGQTYYIQAGYDVDYYPWDVITVEMHSASPPAIDFYVEPPIPSIFDAAQFCWLGWDPENVGIEIFTWDFDDNAHLSTQEWCVMHQYAVDGAYNVSLEAVTFDGRMGAMQKQISVETHDVSITKFTRPQTAVVGQTRRLTVGISNRRLPERVQVELFKSAAYGYEPVGTLILSVPAQDNNRTTDFLFSYVFTVADAKIGKVNFKAVATLLDARDALPGDNEFISFPVTVKSPLPGKKVEPGEIGQSVVESDEYVTDYTSYLGGDRDSGESHLQPEEQIFLPFVSVQ